MSTRPIFDNELRQLNIDLIKMGALVNEAIENSIKALEEQNKPLAENIIQNDRTIDELEKSIEAKSLSLILRQQPVAGDLRTVSTAIKMVTDLERIGDHASDISELVLRIEGEHTYSLIKHIPEMAEASKNMVSRAIAAFVSGDTKQAKKIEADDDIVDELFNKVKKEVIEILKSPAAEHSNNTDNCIDFLMIAKYFERIGDHAQNICEWVEFNQTGEYKNKRIM